MERMKKRLQGKVLNTRGLRAGTSLLSVKRGVQEPLDDDSDTVEGIVHLTYPTYIPTIDYFLPLGLNGKKGFPAGKYHMITGNNESFKSAVLSRLEIAALNSGAIVYHLEKDKHWDKGRFLNGVLGHIKDAEAKKRYKFISVDTYDEVFIAISEIATYHKEHMEQVIKSDSNASWDNTYYARDVQPVIITIDSIASVVSETSMEATLVEGLSKVKVAEENHDLHRLYKNLDGLLDMLGIPVILINQYRANISAGGYGPKRKPYGWDSLEYKINIALDFKSSNEQKITSLKREYQATKILSVTARKIKNQDLLRDNKFPDTQFHVQYGFDIQRSVFDIIIYCGYLVKNDKTITILPENDGGIPIPDPLLPYVGTHVTKDFISEMKKDPQKKADFINAYFKAEATMMPAWVNDRREIHFDDIIFSYSNAEDSEVPEVELVSTESKKSVAKRENAAARKAKTLKRLQIDEVTPEISSAPLEDLDTPAPEAILDQEIDLDDYNIDE